LNYRVYVLQNGAGKYYIGLSDDVSRRLNDHNDGVSRWTKGKGPWTLVWTSEFLSLSEARKLENKLKRQGRGSGFYSLRGFSLQAHNSAAAGS
jgi:predicted GIY-YIG superfamily endonuclease